MAEQESINFKLPKPLAAALIAAAKERKTTATNLVIQGLHHVLGDVEGVATDVDTRLHQLEAQLTKLANQQDTQQVHGVNDSSQQGLPN